MRMVGLVHKRSGLREAGKFIFSRGSVKSQSYGASASNRETTPGRQRCVDR